MSSAQSQRSSSRPSAGKRLEKLLATFLKIAIAVAGICFVILKFSRSEPIAGESHVKLGFFYVSPAFHWNDTATIGKGSTYRGLTFTHDTLVFVVGRTATPDGKPLVRIRFPDRPIGVSMEGPGGTRSVEMQIREDAVIPGSSERLNVPQEAEVPLSFLKAGEGAGAEAETIHEGLHTLFINARARWYLLVFAWLLLGIPFFVTAIRWRNLMAPQGIRMPLGKCLQLTFVGQFYSIILPGITGGDLVKIVYAARLVGSKTKAFITIILDRVIGLMALMGIAGVSAGIQLLLNVRAGKAMDNTLFNVFILIVGLLVGLAVAATVYFSHRLRRLVGIEWFVENAGKLTAQAQGETGETAQHEKLEHLFRVSNGVLLLLAVVAIGALAGLRWGAGMGWMVKNTTAVWIGLGVAAALGMAAGAGLVLHEKLVNRMTPIMRRVVGMIIRIDETLHVYRGHFGLLFWAFAISLISQLSLPLSAWLSGRAFGMTAPVAYYLAYVPIAVLAASLPISPPQGFGVMDYILFHFFVERGTARAGQAVALAQSVRFLPIIWNSMGAYWVVTGKYSRHQAEAEEQDLPDELPGPGSSALN